MTKILREIGIAALSAFCSALVLCSVAIFPAGAVAQTYPTKPMRIVVPNVPGSGTDVIARLIGGKLSEALGQPIVTDTGCDILNVPYKGSALALTGTLAGEVHMAFQSIPLEPPRRNPKRT
jgi:tripartite-type tricarboxylate transporter receptor subunit TctC